MTPIDAAPDSSTIIVTRVQMHDALRGLFCARSHP